MFAPTISFPSVVLYSVYLESNDNNTSKLICIEKSIAAPCCVGSSSSFPASKSSHSINIIISNNIALTTVNSVICSVTWCAFPLESSTVVSAPTDCSMKNIDSPIETCATSISKPASSAASVNLANISSIFKPVKVCTSSPYSAQS